MNKVMGLTLVTAMLASSAAYAKSWDPANYTKEDAKKIRQCFAENWAPWNQASCWKMVKELGQE